MDVRLVRRHPSATLLVVQLLGVLAYPFFGESGLGKALLGTVGTVMVLVAIWAVRFTPALAWIAAVLGMISMVAVGLALGVVRNTPALTFIAVVLGVPALLMTVLEAVLPGEEWVVLTSALLHAPFYLYVFFGTIRYLFHDDRVTTDELYATGAAFTVVAWGFAYVFAIVQAIWPGSFANGEGDHMSWFNLLFLSFTNLTSVGLSDVLPVDGHARSLVMVEQVAGVLYVALVIARLVGLTVARAAARGADD